MNEEEKEEAMRHFSNNWRAALIASEVHSAGESEEGTREGSTLIRVFFTPVKADIFFCIRDGKTDEGKLNNDPGSVKATWRIKGHEYDRRMPMFEDEARDLYLNHIYSIGERADLDVD